MIKVTVEGPQGSGKTQIAGKIFSELAGYRLPYQTNQLRVEIFDDEVSWTKAKKKTDVIIVTKQTKGASK